MSQLRLRQIALAFFVGGLTLAHSPTKARPSLSSPTHSRKLVNDESLSVQPSSQAGASSLTNPSSGSTENASTAATGTSSSATDTTGTQTPSGLVGQVLPVTAVTAATQFIPLPQPSNSQNNMLQQLMQGLSGMGGNGASNRSSGSGYGSGSPSSSSSSPSSGSNFSPGGSSGGGGSRSDEVGSAAPLPADVQISGRNCSATATTWQPPTAGSFRTTSCFGYRRSTGSHHDGVDMVLEDRTIRPVAPGKIIEAKWRGAYGCQIIIEHETCPSAIGGTKCYSQYAHLKCESGFGPSCRCPASGNVGQKVNPCSKLGQMGQTGGNSTGEHLHLEVRTSSHSNAKDPVRDFKEWQAHTNYNYKQSNCGTVGKGGAPMRQQQFSHGGGSREGKK